MILQGQEQRAACETGVVHPFMCCCRLQVVLLFTCCHCVGSKRLGMLYKKNGEQPCHLLLFRLCLCYELCIGTTRPRTQRTAALSTGTSTPLDVASLVRENAELKVRHIKAESPCPGCVCYVDCNCAPFTFNIVSFAHQSSIDTLRK
jgi:hypothetical protein